ncbi:MAG TPA: BON domain-containing protein [Abditibacteriaceae bacterium]|jgi:prepilin-type processing-associated H-X9-DG protein
MRNISTTKSLIAAAAATVLSIAALPAQAQEGYATDADAATATRPASAARQPANFTEMLSGKNLPLRLRMADLTSAYRRMVVSGASDAGGAFAALIAMQTGMETNVYYTKGQTVSLGGETYLVAYRPQVQVDPNAAHHHGPRPVEPRKLPPNMPLALSLLNLRTSGSLNDVRPFDAKEDMQTPQEGAAASVRQLQTLGQGVISYVRNRGGGRFPQIGATITPAVQRTFYPYVHDSRKWNNPANEELYRPNTALSGKRLSRIANARFVPMFYEGTPANDGTRAVLFVDGHVERLSPERFARVRSAAIVMRAAASAAETATLTQKIKAALAADTNLRNNAIEVSLNSEQETVTLRGTVRTAANRFQAGRLARQAAPAYRVVNNLRVSATTTASRTAATGAR